MATYATIPMARFPTDGPLAPRTRPTQYLPILALALAAVGAVGIMATTSAPQSLYASVSSSAVTTARPAAVMRPQVQGRAVYAPLYATPPESDAEAAEEPRKPGDPPKPNPNEYDFTEVNRIRSGGKLGSGQSTAIAAGVVSVILGILYLSLVSFLDSRELMPPPPEALGL